MDILHVFSMILLFTAVFSYINCRFLKLPTSIGLMVTSLIVASTMIFLGESGLFPGFFHWAEGVIAAVDFDAVLMRGMLGVLLFAGALHVELDDLLRHKLAIGLLATVGVVFSAFFVAFLLLRFA